MRRTVAAEVSESGLTLLLTEPKWPDAKGEFFLVLFQKPR
jgi:hypothetical protein